jgi:hypothetical protein
MHALPNDDVEQTSYAGPDSDVAPEIYRNCQSIPGKDFERPDKKRGGEQHQGWICTGKTEPSQHIGERPGKIKQVAACKRGEANRKMVPRQATR